MNEELLLKRLKRPQGRADVVIDTDTFNEVDDQYALAYLIKSDDKLDLKAIYAAPFSNEKAKTPKAGMEKSYAEILNILSLMEREDLKQLVYKGSETYLPDEKTAVVSEAAKDLAARAMAQPENQPLYVVAIGAITNVASAILLKPEIIDKIVVIWLGGHALDWVDINEFNMYQDIAAARVVFGCGVPLVQLPCLGVVSEFRVTEPELIYWLKGKNKLCDYLVDVTVNEGRTHEKTPYWSRVIWDVTTVAWLLDSRFMEERLEHSPIPQYDLHYSFDARRHFMKYVYWIHRDALIEDLFTKLSK